MADVTWYDQKIPPELQRRMVIDHMKLVGGLTLLFATIVLVVFPIGVFVFRARVGPIELAMMILLPALPVVIGILSRPRRPRNVVRVGVSRSGVSLSYEDGGSLDLPWESVSGVECMKKEDYYGLFDPCILSFTNADGRDDSVLLFREPGVALRRETWRRDFRKWRESAEPVERPGFSEEDYATPRWAVDGLIASYREDEDFVWYRIALGGPEALLQWRVDWDPEFVRQQKEFHDLTYEDPEAFRIWERVEREWAETPLREWQESKYGDFFINPRRDPDRQWTGKGPARFLGREPVAALGARRSALRFDTSVDEDCVCVHFRKSPPSSGLGLLALRGFFEKLPPGTCPECEGRVLERRSCVECRGTGKHGRCGGTGRLQYETRTWYEERTGILLRQETWEKGKLVGTWGELESLEPNILARA